MTPALLPRRAAVRGRGPAALVPASERPLPRAGAPVTSRRGVTAGAPSRLVGCG
jgi:hypothetical protein